MAMALPDIALTATSGGVVNLSQIAGWLVVFCYPWTGQPGRPNPPNWDDIPGAHGSTPQAEGYRDLIAEFNNRDVQVFGLSLQRTAYQAEFATRVHLPYPLLSDAERRFSSALGLETFSTGGADYLKRLSLIGRDGNIVHRCDHIEEPAADAVKMLRCIDGLT